MRIIVVLLSGLMEAKLPFLLMETLTARASFAKCRGVLGLGFGSQSSGRQYLAIARLHFREVHQSAGDMVHVVGEDIQRDVGHGLNDVSVGQAEGTRLLEIGIVDFAALHYQAARQFEDGVGLLCRSSGKTRVSDIFLGGRRIIKKKRLRAE